MSRIIPVLTCVALAGPGLAAPSFDCAKASGTVEELICADADLAALDRVLAVRYSAALDATRGLDAGAEAAQNGLRTEQRGWIKGRNECWKADDPRACVEAAYLMREGDLVARWILQEPVATTFWTCGSPANELVTMFFDTRLPSVRFERGDTVDTGTLVPTGSGSRYAGSFGRSLWIKGDEATWREADPDGTTFTCTAAGN